MSKIKYDNRGRKVDLVQELEDGSFLVNVMGTLYRQEYDDYSEHQESVGLEIVNKIFDKPPVDIFDKKIKDKSDELDSLNEEIMKARNEIYSLRSNEKDLKLAKKEIYKKLSEVKNLENLEDYLEGRMEWYFMPCGYGYSLKIGHVTDLRVNNYNDRNYINDMKMISLTGKYKNENKLDKPSGVEWSLFNYSDGSGSKRRIHLFKTEGDAKDFAKKFLVEMLETPNQKNRRNRWLISFDKLGIEPPENYKDQIKSIEEEALRKKEDDRLKKIEETKEQLKILMDNSQIPQPSNHK